MVMEADVLLLPRAAVSAEEFDLIAGQLASEQIPIKMLRGKVSYKLGTLISARIGREGLFGKVAFNPGIKLRTEGADKEIRATFVEWVPREV